MLTMYGIPNCDTIKKAKKHLENAGLDYIFHDYKKLGVKRDIIDASIAATSVDTVVNKRGTTYRKLSDEDKSIVMSQTVDNTAIIDLLCTKPSIIKRPILVRNSGNGASDIVVGFSEASYQEFIQNA